MSDKEFDAFFKSSVKDLEVEPAERVWAGITHRLDEKVPQKAQSFRINWIAAASIILVGTLAFVLFGKSEKTVWLNQQPIAEVAEEMPLPPRTITRKPLELIHQKKDRFAGMTNEERFLTIMSELEEPKAENKQKVESDATILPMKNVLSKKENTPELAVAAKEEQALVTEDVQLAMTEPEETKSGSKEKSKIRSVGDLVNFVIAKVDKREEKIVHIAKTEESDLEITGINLGLFRYKKN